MCSGRISKNSRCVHASKFRGTKSSDWTSCWIVSFRFALIKSRGSQFLNGAGAQPCRCAARTSAAALVCLLALRGASADALCAAGTFVATVNGVPSSPSTPQAATTSALQAVLNANASTVGAVLCAGTTVAATGALTVPAGVLFSLSCSTASLAGGCVLDGGKTTQLFVVQSHGSLALSGVTLQARCRAGAVPELAISADSAAGPSILTLCNLSRSSTLAARIQLQHRRHLGVHRRPNQCRAACRLRRRWRDPCAAQRQRHRCIVRLRQQHRRCADWGACLRFDSSLLVGA